jgi:hypothetical protein
VGFVGGLTPFVIALYEFTKRIVIQRQCAVCAGSGLVQKGRFKKKCPACGKAPIQPPWWSFLANRTRTV